MIKSTESCDKSAGQVVPVIDRNRCEGKAACISVCPYGVFEIGTLKKDARQSLSVRGKLKAWFHGGKQAFVVEPKQCHGCNLCVEACPEKAIKLQPYI